METQSVLVTGAARGIGRATAIAFGRRGAKVCLNYLSNQAAAEEAAAATLAAGAADVLVQQADVADREAVGTMIERLSARFGGLDIVVNNAGFGQLGRLTEISEEDWDRTFATHIKGPFYVCRAAMPLLQRSPGACIVNLGSVAGLRGLPAAICYGTVKAAIIQFTRCLAWELADQNIRVNAVCPGIIRTDFHLHMTEAAKEHNLKNRVPLHREGQPEQIADTITFIVDNQYLTGETITVDGGLTMRIC